MQHAFCCILMCNSLWTLLDSIVVCPTKKICSHQRLGSVQIILYVFSFVLIHSFINIFNEDWLSTNYVIDSVLVTGKNNTTEFWQIVQWEVEHILYPLSHTCPKSTSKLGGLGWMETLSYGALTSAFDSSAQDPKQKWLFTMSKWQTPLAPQVSSYSGLLNGRWGRARMVVSGHQVLQLRELRWTMCLNCMRHHSVSTTIDKSLDRWKVRRTSEEERWSR